jgi:hypothetical protein
VARTTPVRRREEPAGHLSDRERRRRAPLGGVGVSSPIVSGDRVFVTPQIGTEVRRAGNHPDRAGMGQSASARCRTVGDDRTFFVVEAFSRNDGSDNGSTGWKRRTVARVHDKHPATPARDGQMVYARSARGRSWRST